VRLAGRALPTWIPWWARRVAREQSLTRSDRGRGRPWRLARVLVPPPRSHAPLALAGACDSSHAGSTERAQGASASRGLLPGTRRVRLDPSSGHRRAATPHRLAIRI